MRSVLLHGSVPKSHYLKYVFVLCSDSTTIIYLSSSLHWLPIDSQIQYKLASLCCNCLKSTAPVYLTEVTNQPASYALLLTLPLFVFPLCPRTRSDIFSFAALSVWNSLPCKVRSSNRLASFKSAVKSYLFELFCSVCVFMKVCFDHLLVLCL